jgi:myo-inositol 2-dehydrogenase/D-chiro-inositol 1-dehydrogenase
MNAPANRRTFLKTTAGAALAQVAIPHVHAAHTDELKIALIGCGGRGTGACVQALSTDGPVKLWAMADAFPDQLEKSYQNLVKGTDFSRSPDAGPQTGVMDVPPERRFTGLDAFQKVLALPEIDVVILTTPPGFRPMMFEAAVEAGKHVFMEKPVAVDGPGVRRVLKAAQLARKKNLKTAVGHDRRHSPLYQEWIKRMHDDEIGKLITLRSYYLSRGVGKYYARTPEDTELKYQIRSWYYFTWLSGDHIVEQQVHQADIATWIKDATPVSAIGIGGRQMRNTPDYGQIYDHHTVDYTFPDGTHYFLQTRHMPNCYNLHGEYVDGASGTGGITSKSTGLLKKWDAQDKPFWRARLEENPYQLEHDHLFEAIRNDLPYDEATRGAKSTLTAILGRMATYSGQLVTWEDALNSEVVLGTEALEFDAPAPLELGEDGSYEVKLPGAAGIF